MDAGEQAGGQGIAPNPKRLVLHGLAGCTGMDVVSILEKKKVEYESFDMEVTAEQTNTHPKMFKTIELIYRFKANEDDKKHILRAIELSMGQFCGVSAMLEKSATINWRLELI